ncbi:PREDICTED: uncharacterized protein LOC108780195 [Cyphomyrmex costatus]|uniref:uncharacterized protein LOC108780195 n=1 Tax=Cyphomyrmex costatus TaxID=456900 RepID=UPI00085232B4|nr:PREDICTED: uncharacterized protein LOC108780195 [Cyphomyrmex costatus]
MAVAVVDETVEHKVVSESTYAARRLKIDVRMLTLDNLETSPSHTMSHFEDDYPGSELSFVTEELVKFLRLPRKSATIPLLGIGGTYSGRTKGSVYIELHSSINDSDSYTLHAYILPRLTFQIPSYEVNSDSWSHLNNLQFADPNFGKPGPIHVIIGADCYGQIIKLGIIKNDSSSLIAQLTLFGWVVSGPVAVNSHDNESRIYHCSIDRDLQDLLTYFWKQEEVSNTITEPLSPADADCEQYFLSSHSRDQSGRYIVRLPLKAPATLLGDSSSTALQCLHRLRKRFETQPSFCELYTNFLQQYQSLGHMVPVSEPEVNNSSIFYLPHHGVFRESSRTTKLRVVFNGSSPSKGGVPLNDILHAGAKLQTNIFDVLLWFRSHRFVFSSDITKMYRQILVHPSDRNLQRIFWYDSNGQICPYQLTTVTYGLNCARFLALRVLQQLITDEGHRFPKAISSLTKGRYVDDIFGGAESIEEAQEIISQVCQLCMADKLPLQKWSSNSQILLNYLSLSPTDNTPTVELDSSRIKVLGLCWQPQTDVFKFISVPSSSQVLTKRIVLSEIAQIYDPLEFQNQWASFKKQLLALSNLNIPRWLYITSTAHSIELHGFSDASQLAIAAVVYIRTETQERGVQVNIICAKTKVAPLKKLTIPRLELNAALMLSRLVYNVQNVLDLKERQIFLWTDSSVALTWISSHPAKWKDYVRNRVVAIQEILPSASWRFVPGKDNPADCASRGLSVHEIEHHSLWWLGPSWLNKAPVHWLNWSPISPTNTDLEKSTKHALATVQDIQMPPWELLTKFSCLSKLIQVTATCKRAVKRFRRLSIESTTGHLTPTELQESSQFWIRQVQQSYFLHDLKIIARGGRLSKSNPLIKLTPFLDDTGLMRVGGRLQHANLDPDVKHPLILPKHYHLITLIIADAHLQTLHGGTQVTLAYTRQKYWIIGGRTPVRSYILKCVKCARYRQNRAQQLMGQLPESRVTPSRPFLNSGVDYAGPIMIKTWRERAAKTYKGYLAIFVCFSTSAVHIEVVTDYTTEAFISANKRFTARRGICATLHSDCGTNLIGADNELRRRFDAASKELKELATILANHGTDWRFNPPTSFWRKVGSGILNSRPLCPLSEDIDDYVALTPGHFILGEASTVIPEPNLINQPSSRLTRWQLIRQKVEHFWKRWTTECLQRYQAISKWHHPSLEIKRGSLVLVVDERYPPAKWPLARIRQLIPGKDGLTRVVIVRTATATFKRPVTKICVLSINQAEGIFENSVPEGGRNVRANKK